MVKGQAKYLQQYLPVLRSLHELGPIDLEALLPHLKANVHRAIQECCHNCLNNIRLFNTETRRTLRRKLAPFKNQLQVNESGKKKRIKQAIFFHFSAVEVVV